MLKCGQQALRASTSVYTSLSSFGASRIPASLVFRSTITTPPITLPSTVPIEEELIPNYAPQHFYSVNSGEILNNKYEVMAKPGYGSCLTI